MSETLASPPAARLPLVSRAVTVLAGACVFLVPLLYVISWSFEPIRFYLRSRWFPDDAFYYFEIGRNLASGFGPTFDQMHQTNGFQPLWQVICAVVWWYVPESTPFVHTINVVQAAILAAGLLLIFATTQRIAHCPITSAAALLTAFFFFPFFFAFVNGLETGVYFLMTAAVLFVLVGIRPGTGTRTYVLLGALLCLMFLARLDSGPFAVLVLAWLVLRRTSARHVLLAAAPLAIVGAAYLTYNTAAFGSPMPISGAVKREWGHMNLTRELKAGLPIWKAYAKALAWPVSHPNYYPILAVLVANVCLAVVWPLRRRWPLALFTGFVLFKYVLYVVLFYDHAFFTWYYAVDWIAPLIGVPLLVAWVLRRLSGVAWLRVVGQLAVASAFGLLLWRSIPSYYWSFETQLRHQRAMLRIAPEPANEMDLYYFAAQIVQESHLPPKTVLASHNAGILGFFIDQPVVNFDGLVNDRHRLEHIRRYGLDFRPYVDELKPDIYLDVISEGGIEFYEHAFVNDRGYQLCRLGELVEKRFGKCPVGTLLLFHKPGLAIRGDNDAPRAAAQ